MKKLDGNYIKSLHAVLNKSWKQHSTKQQLYGHLPPISQTTQVRQTLLEKQERTKKNVTHRLVYMKTPVIAHQQRLSYITYLWTLDVV